MFWKYNSPPSTELESLLQREDVTLQDVIDTNDIINECRQQKKALIDFLIRPETINELVEYTIQEPPNDLDSDIRYKNATISCELLTADVPAISERLACDELLLDKLFRFLEHEPPLNPLLASYFSKIMSALIVKKTEHVLDFLKARDTFLPLIFKHLGTSAIMDLALKLMTQVENTDTRQSILNWLDDQRLIQSLIELLNPNVDKERHCNVAQLLCDFIITYRDNLAMSTERVETDPLMETLESPETISLLLKFMFTDDKCESIIVAGIKILLTLLYTYHHHSVSLNFINGPILQYPHFEPAMDFNEEQVLITITERLEDFCDILKNPLNQSAIKTTVGVLNPPFGNTRLQVVKLLAVLVSKDNLIIVEAFANADLFTTLLDLFFQYPWNNFLHTQVEYCLCYGLKTITTSDDVAKSNALFNHLFVECKLIERCLDAWKENDMKQKEVKGIRQAYMGHLIAVVNEISKLYSSSNFGKYLKECLPDTAKILEDFTDTTLKETVEIQDLLLGGTYPKADNNLVFSGSIFPVDQNCQNDESNSRFMIQTNNIEEKDYDNRNELELNVNSTNTRLLEIQDDSKRNADLFERLCLQTHNSFSNDDDDDDDDDGGTQAETFPKKDSSECENTLHNNSDSMFNNPTEVYLNELTTTDPWTTQHNTNSKVVVEEEEWADFSSVDFELDFNAPLLTTCHIEEVFNTQKNEESTVDEEIETTDEMTISYENNCRPSENHTNQSTIVQSNHHSADNVIASECDTDNINSKSEVLNAVNCISLGSSE